MDAVTPEGVIGIAREAAWVMLEIGAPSLLAALVVGVLVSLFQALTQIQESTLAFLPKLVAILLAQIVALPFTLTVLGDFTRLLFGRIAAMGGS
ncbi:flagellar biosynthesis protein FliQ [Geminicoccaceae bacterium SYSU G07066]|uniref:Flagellar biosynthetic protein FliQ n=1 Tax=Benzoatithermus flavus TaxID=3108223 RepID=A0ABU8XXW5_9PROT